MRKALQQGQGDGLCGLYAILNLLNRFPSWRSSPTDGLWALLESCDEAGWLTPYRLTNGFEDFHLEHILNDQILKYRLELECHRLSDVKASQATRNIGEVIEAVIRRKGAVITTVSKGGHWICVASYNGVASVYDSARSDSAVHPLTERKIDQQEWWGVITLPKKRASLQLGL